MINLGGRHLQAWAGAAGGVRNRRIDEGSAASLAVACSGPPSLICAAVAVFMCSW
jgi:hypothetical protein